MKIWAKVRVKANEKLAGLYTLGDTVKLDSGETATVSNIDEMGGFVELDMADTGSESGIEEMKYKLPDQTVPLEKM